MKTFNESNNVIKNLLDVKPEPETIVSGSVNDIPIEFWIEIETYLKIAKSKKMD
jgi:hypothetical protein